MNTNSVKSVSDSSKQGKSRPASGSKSNRRKNKKKKEQVEFVAIPKQDLIWAKEQKPSVMKFWMECWECDPYGSRWMTLNHSLSRSAFTKAKKIISERGLFIFKPDHSIKDGREVVSWLVQNLHGSRRSNFGIKLTDSIDTKMTDSGEVNSDSGEVNSDSNKANGDLYEASISSKSYTESQIQSVSITPQKRLTNSSEEVVRREVECFSDESDRDTALEERVTSASPKREKTEAEGTNPTEVQSDLVNKSNSDSKQVAQSADKEAPEVLNKKSTQEILNQPYSVDRYSTDTVELSKAQNLAFEADKTSPTYQTSFSEASARAKAKLAQESKKDKIKRFGYERNPMSFSDIQALEEYKRELESNRPEITQEDFWDDSEDF